MTIFTFASVYPSFFPSPIFKDEETKKVAILRYHFNFEYYELLTIDGVLSLDNKVTDSNGAIISISEVVGNYKKSPTYLSCTFSFINDNLHHFKIMTIEDTNVT